VPGGRLMARFGEIYTTLKQMIMRAELPRDEYIRMSDMARHFGVSLIPLREAVRQLEGEGLLKLGYGSGFHVLQQDGDTLEHRYRCHRDIIRVAMMQMSVSNDLAPLRQWARVPIDSGEPEYLAVRTAQMFGAVARASRNWEYPPIIARLSEGLHAARIAEAELFDDAREELEKILEMARSASKPTLKKRFSEYHRVRIEHAFGIAKVIRKSATGTKKPVSPGIV
jgi:DNA-binding GntR family transcriptional regulator